MNRLRQRVEVLLAYSTDSKPISKMALITQQARILLSAYRRDDLADPEGFVAQLGMVLEGFPDAVIIAVTDPRTGIQRRLKFMPTIAEIVEACEAECVAQNTRARYAAMPKPQKFVPLPRDDRAGRRANLFIHADAPMYAQAVTWSQTADPADWKWDEEGRPGIWVGLNWHTMIQPAKGLNPLQTPDGADVGTSVMTAAGLSGGPPSP